MLMRLLCDNLLLASSCKGSPGVEDLRWMRPVHPGDRLTASADVVSARPLTSRPDLGIVQFVFTLTNQDNIAVMSEKSAILFERREAGR